LIHKPKIRFWVFILFILNILVTLVFVFC